MSAQDYYNGGSGLGSYQNQSPYPQQRQSQGASSPYQQQQPQYVQQPSDRLYPGSDPNAADGERGIGSTLVGGGAGSYIGHKLGKGTMGTLLGGAVGAVAANFISHKVKGRHGKEEHDGYHSHHGHHGHPGQHHGPPSYHGGPYRHGGHSNFLSDRSHSRSPPRERGFEPGPGPRHHGHPGPGGPHGHHGHHGHHSHYEHHGHHGPRQGHHPPHGPF